MQGGALAEEQGAAASPAFAAQATFLLGTELRSPARFPCPSSGGEPAGAAGAGRGDPADAVGFDRGDPAGAAGAGRGDPAAAGASSLPTMREPAGIGRRLVPAPSPTPTQVGQRAKDVMGRMGHSACF